MYDAECLLYYRCSEAEYTQTTALYSTVIYTGPRAIHKRFKRWKR